MPIDSEQSLRDIQPIPYFPYEPGMLEWMLVASILLAALVWIAFSVYRNRRRTKLIEPAEVQIQRILERKSFLVEVPQESELSHLILLLRQYISQNTLRSLIGMSSREIRQYAESPSSGAFSELLMLLSALDDLRYSGNALHNWPELARKIKLELLEISRSRGLKK